MKHRLTRLSITTRTGGDARCIRENAPLQNRSMFLTGQLIHTQPRKSDYLSTHNRIIFKNT